ncbi:Ku protein [Paenibacillus antri]|uniref:Non-homologous end joining protein Ku n=1 Tax=Paenibacillus antri TaxID=2582848 RepID=A0A5R9GBD8_9BACL|nr:Ku protein [Paenibacillus antri]TLS50033.1 Ku protein [Paenibacillus antri]
MHTIWKGTINIGLVQIPVKLYSTTDEKDITFQQLHKECGTPVQSIRTCPSCKTEVKWDDIEKGFEYDLGRYVLFGKDELDVIAGEKIKEAKVHEFVNLGDINPVYFQKSYYVGPDVLGGDAYKLLVQALNGTRKAAVCTITIRSRGSVALIQALQNGLVLTTAYYSDEVRQIEHVPNLENNKEVSEDQLKLANLLIKQMSRSFDLSKFKDEYRLRLQNAIQQKVAGQQVVFVESKSSTEKILDLVQALKASIQENEKKTEKPKKRKKTAS